MQILSSSFARNTGGMREDLHRKNRSCKKRSSERKTRCFSGIGSNRSGLDFLGKLRFDTVNDTVARNDDIAN